MSDQKNVTVTMPMDEYLKLTKPNSPEVNKLLEDLVIIVKLSPITPGGNYGIQYTKFGSLRDVCNAARKALGYMEAP